MPWGVRDQKVGWDPRSFYGTRVIRVCPGCLRHKSMMPDQIKCDTCEEEDVNPRDMIGEDFGWRR